MGKFIKEFGKGFRSFWKVWRVCVEKSFSRSFGFIVAFILVKWACDVVWEIIKSQDSMKVGK